MESANDRGGAHWWRSQNCWKNLRKTLDKVSIKHKYIKEIELPPNPRKEWRGRERLQKLCKKKREVGKNTWEKWEGVKPRKGRRLEENKENYKNKALINSAVVADEGLEWGRKIQKIAVQKESKGAVSRRAYIWSHLVKFFFKKKKREKSFRMKKTFPLN